MKWRTGILALGMAAVLCLTAGCGFINEAETSAPDNASAPAVEQQEPELVGSWDCIVEEDDQTYLLRFGFAEDGSVTYDAGWYRSEWAATYSGSYTVSGDTVTMELTCNEDGSTLAPVFTAMRDGDTLSLTLQSGDPVTYVQQVGDTLEYAPTEE